MNRLKGLMIAYISMLRKRDNNLWVFGAWFGEEFADNSKYLFLRALREGINAVWITKNEKVYNKLKAKQYPVEMYDSDEGINIMKKAGYAIWSVDLSDVNKYYLGGAKFICLNHGIPLKKVGFDDNITVKKSFISRIVKEKIINGIPYYRLWSVATSPILKKITMSAFRINENRVLEVGYPRNDYFFDDEYIEETDFSFLKGNKVIAYMPTHRNEGKKTIEIDKILDLKSIDKICEEENYIFLIKKHYYHKSETTDLKRYSNIIDITSQKIDPQELLKRVDVLISDYSGSYIDYLLLDRPIIFYNFDMKEYLNNDREMYFDYNEVTPGSVIDNRDELTKEIKNICRYGIDDYKDERKRVRKIFFGNHKGSCGHELLQIIKKL